MSLKIVFMGTPEFSVPTLNLLIKNKFNVVKVYTQPPKKSKRGQKLNSLIRVWVQDRHNSAIITLKMGLTMCRLGNLYEFITKL